MKDYEKEYKKLTNDYEALCRERKNQKVNLETMDKLLSVMLNEFSEHSSDYIQSNARTLYNAAGVVESNFENNFVSINGLELTAKKVFLDAIDKELEVPVFWIGSQRISIAEVYSMGLKKLFEFISNPENKIRVEFALCRFGEQFWAMAMRDLYPAIVDVWKPEDDETLDKAYERYTHVLRMQIQCWMGQGFSKVYMEKYIEALSPLSSIYADQMSALESIAHLVDKPEELFSK